MRRLPKILALLLTVCLAFAVIAVIAVALDPSATTDHGVADDYEDWEPGTDYTNGFPSASNSAGNYSSLKVVHNEKSDNNYIQFVYKKSSTKKYTREYKFSPTNDLSAYSYYTVDFDVCADQYLYELNGETQMSRNVPDGAENVRLSYSEETSFSLDNRPCKQSGITITSGKDYYSLCIGFVYDGSNWRIQLDQKDTGYTLPNRLDVWSHFTYAVETRYENSSYGYSKVRVYFNGGLLGTSYIFMKDSTKANAVIVKPRAIEWSINKTNIPYSMGIDNFTPTFYYKGYTSGNSYGIDDLFADENKNVSIVYCEDVIYSASYAQPGNPYFSVDTGTTKWYIPYLKDEILSKLKNGAVIETCMDISDYTPPENVDNFDVYLLDGATFSLSKSALQKYVIESSAIGYSVSRISNEKAITLKWYDAKGGAVVKEELLTPGVVPRFGTETIGKIDYENKNVTTYNIEKWMWDIDGENTYFSPVDIHALTLDDINLIKQTCGGVLEAYPVIDTGVTPVAEPLAYSISYLKGDVRIGFADTNGTYDAYKDITTFAEQVSNAPDNAIVCMYADATTDATITLGAEHTMYIDLCGNNLKNLSGKAFDLANGSNLYIYSSVAGAKVSAPTAFYACRANFNNCNVYLGKYGEYDGANVSFEAATLFEIKTPYTGANDDQPINITIDGSDVSGAFVFGAPDINLSVNSANMSVEDILINCDLEYEVFNGIEADISVNGGLIDASYVIGNFPENCTLELNGVKVIGHIDSSEYVQEGTVLVGEGCAFTNDVRVDGGMLTLDENLAFAISDKDMTASGHDFRATLLVFDLTDYDESEYTLAVWNDAKGNKFKEAYYHTTVSAVSHPDVYAMSDKSKFPTTDLKNGWYDLGYSSWKNTAEGSVNNAIVHGVKNVFAPVYGGVVPSVDYLVNASLRNTDVALNFYLKIPAPDSGIAIEGFFVSVEGQKIEATLGQDFAGAEGYYAYELALDLASFETRYAYITFTVSGYDGNGDGEITDSDEDKVTLYKEIEVDFMTYAETAVEISACGSDASKLIFDLVQYKYTAYRASLGDDSEEESEIDIRVANFFNVHGKGCNCRTNLDSIVLPEEETRATIEKSGALKNVVSEAGFTLVDGKPTLCFYVNKDVEIKSFSVKLKGLEHQLGGWDYINHKYTCDMERVDNVIIDGTEYAVYVYPDLLLCNAASIMNITVEAVTTPASEGVDEVCEVLTGSYSLAAFIQSGAGEQVELAKALYAASKSALEYRYIRDGEAA